MTAPYLPGLGRYVLSTNQVEDFVNVARLWIQQSVPGALIYGRQRIGKSTAASYFVDNVAALFDGQVGCVWVQVEPGTVNNPRQFWGDLLKSMRVHVPPSKPTEVRRDWFVGRIVDAAASNASNKAVVIVDEASALTEPAWILLLGVDNTLRQIYGVDLTWIFVGQPELGEMPALLRGLGRREIVGRFMADYCEFREMSSVDDFRRALSAYDKLVNPTDGRVLSERAHPQKFAGGWRFEDEAELLYRVVQAVRMKANLMHRDGMGMQAFARLTSHLLAETVPKLGRDEPLTVRHVVRAIRVTGCLMFEENAEFLQELPEVPEPGRRRGGRSTAGV